MVQLHRFLQVPTRPNPFEPRKPPPGLNLFKGRKPCPTVCIVVTSSKTMREPCALNANEKSSYGGVRTVTLERDSAQKSWGRTGHRWRVVRAQCFERDRSANAPCWICGKPINYAASDGPDSWQPDHVLEVDSHPELALDPTNIKPSHAICNNRRGQAYKSRKRAAQELGEPSEDWGL